MLYYSRGSEDDVLNSQTLKEALNEVFEKLGNKRKILAIPPDFTRYHSRAGELTTYVYDYYKEKLIDILPALGTHFAMNENELNKMYPGLPHNLFRTHDWRNDIVTLGEVPSEYIEEVSEGRVSYSWPAQVNKLLVEGEHDLILSIGQVVPHEVVGMANYNKNIFVGTGGAEGINKSHFLGAVYGMERMIGRADTPVRKVLNYASDNFAQNLPILYIQTVVAKDENGKPVVRGLYIGDDYQCFKLAAELSQKVNFDLLDEPLKKIVVYLDPEEFKSTWLGNKSIYRTRMALADRGELLVLAPGLREFGEDPEIDRLIRKYGYSSVSEILEFIKNNDDLKNNLSAAAHLIHGPSERRFNVTYCPGHLTQKEVESVYFNYADLNEMLEKYNPNKLEDGYNKMADGEEIFFVSNPALGLWASTDRFNN